MPSLGGVHNKTGMLLRKTSSKYQFQFSVLVPLIVWLPILVDGATVKKAAVVGGLRDKTQHSRLRVATGKATEWEDNRLLLSW